MAQKNIHNIYHSSNQRLIFISQQGWYLRTREGLKGPFDHEQDAKQFLETTIHKARTSRHNQQFTWCGNWQRRL